MQGNIGFFERILRVALGLILIALVFLGPQTQWGWLGLVPLLTALVGFCPIHSLIGLDTRPRARRR